MVDDSSVLPVFGVKAPSSFSTEYPEDNSQVFPAQGLVEVDQLGSPYGDCSEELFSDADNRDNFMVTQTYDAHGDASDSTVTKTFPEDTSNLDVDKTQTGAVSEMVMQTEEAQGDASDSIVTKTFPEDTSDLDVDKTQTGAVSESTFQILVKHHLQLSMQLKRAETRDNMWTQVLVHSRRDLKVKQVYLTIILMITKVTI